MSLSILPSIFPFLCSLLFLFHLYYILYQNFIKSSYKLSLFHHCCCCCCRQVASVMSDSVRPHRWQPTRLPVPGILQARTLEWVAISFSNAWKWKVKGKSLGRVWLLATPWTAAYQAPPSIGFSRQKYWSGVPLPSPNTVYKVAENMILTMKKALCLFLVLDIERVLEKYWQKGYLISDR